jgi:hypothetical protein
VGYLLEKLIKPRVSFWHLILTPFLEPDPTTIVMLDILIADDKLYRGRYAAHDIERAGDLRGILLREPLRFDRKRWEKDKEGNNKPSDKKKYWKKIPSQSLYFPASMILNLNVTHEPASVNPEKTRTAVAALLGRSPNSFVVEYQGPADEDKTRKARRSPKPR